MALPVLLLCVTYSIGEQMNPYTDAVCQNYGFSVMSRVMGGEVHLPPADG